MYEVYSLSGHYVLHHTQRSLWCSRLTGSLVPSNSNTLDVSLEPVCLGTCEAIVGKIQFLADSPENLVLITQVEEVCNLHGHQVYRIMEIVMLPLSLETPELDLPNCDNHPKPPKGEKVADTDAKIERKLEEAFIKWFEGSFYYSLTGDITHNLTEMSDFTQPDLPLWKRVKERYFWNFGMLQEFISSYTQYPDLCDPWIIPVMQGYIESISVDVSEVSLGMLVQGSLSLSPSTSQISANKATLTVISRRSKHRAGTRFKRRGIDDDGHPANYVETEQLLSLNDPGNTQLSYTIIRGSVPVYWYQPLTNYRPKPVILRTSEESLEAFKKHMDGLISNHKKVVVVNLLDAEGKEAPLGEEFARVAYLYNNENLTYIAFDFNEYCGGMKFDNVSVLLKTLDGITDNFGFTHVSNGQVVQKQEGAVRVNCMDSLDRTNVVQGSIVRQSLINQVVGLDIPANNLSAAAKQLWANNGDAISTQYAGTAALKGDYTRTGERGVAGIMRDGVSSVTRMYINMFRDNNRQAAIDIMQQLEPDTLDLRTEKSEELDCIPMLMEEGSQLLPSEENNKTQKSGRYWVCQEWPSGEACAVCLVGTTLTVVFKDDLKHPLPLSTCDRLHIGQPPECLGHYIRIINGKSTFTLRPLTNDISRLQDLLMMMAHAIVNSREALGLTTQVLHGPLAKSDIVDLGLDKIKSSANSFGTKIAAGAQSMMGRARGVLDSRSADHSAGSSPKTINSPKTNNSPRNSPKFGKRMLNLFRRDEQVETPPTTPSVRLSELVHRSNLHSPDNESVTTTSDTSSLPELDEDKLIPYQQYPLRGTYSDSDISKLSDDDRNDTGTRQNRAATFHTLDNFKNSKSNFIFLLSSED